MQPILSVSQLVGIVNDTLAATLAQVSVEGEVAGYKEWNQRLAFFDIKDEDSSVNCMIPLSYLNTPIEDGMKVRLDGVPKLTKKGRFSLSVVTLRPAGEGAIKKAFELLKAKLEKEGLLAEERKRSLPLYPTRIGVITSLGSAAYQDFLKIINTRWLGMEVLAYNSQVQGDGAEKQVIAGIEYFNQLPEPVEILVLIRGGGSQEDLLAFNSESVARAVAASRTPIVVGIGHEVDTSLAELVADMRAATPTDAARLITPDRDYILDNLEKSNQILARSIQDLLVDTKDNLDEYLKTLSDRQTKVLTMARDKINSLSFRLSSLNPENVLRRGYVILRKDNVILRSIGEISIGDRLMLQLSSGNVEAEVLNVEKN